MGVKLIIIVSWSQIYSTKNNNLCRLGHEQSAVFCHRGRVAWMIHSWCALPVRDIGHRVLISHIEFCTYLGYLAQFRRDIIFKDEIVDLADEVFTKLLKVNRCLRLKRFQSQDINCTVVVVHLRMGGFNIHVIKKGWVAIQNTTYLPKAFKHVATHYKVNNIGCFESFRFFLSL